MRVWLENLGLARYADLFADNHIGLDVVAYLKKDDLKELGICIGDRLRLRHAIKSRASEATENAPVVTLAPTNTRQFIAETPAPPALSSDAERRPLTVMFCDLADSTALSTRLDPEDLQDVIRSYQKTSTKLIQDYGGFVAKYMGDGILVYFGYPKSLERNAERRCAARSALLRRWRV